MYADFESILEKVEGCENDSSKSYTQKLQKHVPCGSCLYVVSSDGKYFQPPEVNHGPDAAEKFLDQVMATSTKIRQYLKRKIPMERLTPEQWNEFNHASECHICGKGFQGNNYVFIFFWL